MPNFSAGFNDGFSKGFNRGFLNSGRDQKILNLKPFLWFKLNNSSGSNIFDDSGNARNQTLEGSSANFWKAGKYGNCGYFNHTIPNYISLPTSYFDGTKGTWCCWVKADWSGMSVTYSRLFGTYHTSGANYMHRTYFSGSDFHWTVANGSGTANVDINSIDTYDNTFAHIGFTWEYSAGSGNTIITAYLNGAHVDDSLISGQLANPNQSLWVCRWQSGYITAHIDDFLFFQKCLSDSEMKTIYDA